MFSSAKQNLLQAAMDPSAQYQQQLQPVDSQAYDPSQYQTYDPYYAYHAQYHQQQQYNDQYAAAAAAYYNQSYANPNPPPEHSHPEPSSIHPPGVPVPPQTTYLSGSDPGLAQTHSYYPQTLPSPDPAAVQGQHWENQGRFGAVASQGGPRPPKFLLTRFPLV